MNSAAIRLKSGATRLRLVDAVASAPMAAKRSKKKTTNDETCTDLAIYLSDLLREQAVYWNAGSSHGVNPNVVREMFALWQGLAGEGVKAKESEKAKLRELVVDWMEDCARFNLTEKYFDMLKIEVGHHPQLIAALGRPETRRQAIRVAKAIRANDNTEKGKAGALLLECLGLGGKKWSEVKATRRTRISRGK